MTPSDPLPVSGQAPPAPDPVPTEETEKEKVITKILRSHLAQGGPWWNRRLPALLGLMVVVIGLAVTVFLTLQERRARTQAAQSLAPQEVKVTNVSFSSLTVSWTTSQETSGFVSYGREPEMGQTALDDRDSSLGETGLYQNHYITLTDLDPGANYFFEVGSGGVLFGDEDAPFQAETAPLISSSSVFDPAYGQVFRPDGSPAEGAIVYLVIPDCLALSTLVKASGGWLAAKNLSLEGDGLSFCQYPRQGGNYSLAIQGEAGEKSQVNLLNGLDKPVPDITLGDDYSFKDLSALKPLGTPQPTPALLPLPTASPQLLQDGDLNGDGVINTWDLGILKSNFGDHPEEEKADLNRDGVVDQKDLDILLQIFDQ